MFEEINMQEGVRVVHVCSYNSIFVGGWIMKKLGGRMLVGKCWVSFTSLVYFESFCASPLVMINVRPLSIA